MFESTESPRKRQRRLPRSERIVVSKLNPTMLAMMDAEKVVDILLNILCDAAMPPRSVSTGIVGPGSLATNVEEMFCVF